MSNAKEVVVITGGATGIGFGLAKAFGAEGASIVIAEPRPEKLAQAVAALQGEGIEALGVPCDVTDLEQVEALADTCYDTHGQVDVLVNNAGVGHPRASVAELDMAALRAMFEVNFFGVWHGCRVFGPRMQAQGTNAAIYNTGSENSLFTAAPKLAGYVAAKHAVLGLTDALREELPPPMRVGIIMPGFVASDLTRGVSQLAMPADEYAPIVVRQIREGRFYVVSHAYNRVHIDRRHEELAASYEQYAPRYEGDDEYDVPTLLARMAAERQGE